MICLNNADKINLALGGFKVSFKTDVIQGIMVVALIIIATISVGAETDINRDAVEDSGLLDDSLLGWQLLYILPVAIFSNVFFLAVSKGTSIPWNK